VAIQIEKMDHRIYTNWRILFLLEKGTSLGLGVRMICNSPRFPHPFPRNREAVMAIEAAVLPLMPKAKALAAREPARLAL
jgi:hypothetical protein